MREIGGLSIAALLSLGVPAFSQSPPPTSLHMGSGVTLASGRTIYSGGVDTLSASGSSISFAGPALFGNTGTVSASGSAVPLAAGLAFAAGSLTPSWQGPAVSALGPGLTDVGGTLAAQNALLINGGCLLGNSGTATATATCIATGANVTLAAGTLSVSAPGLGTVTQIIAGPGLSGGTITGAGTLGVYSAITLAGTAAGTLAVAPASGVSDVVINMPAAGGTVTLGCSPTFARQRWIEEIHQGATAGVLNLGTAYIFGTAPASYTATATAAAIDRLMIISPDLTHCAVMAINQGFAF